MEMKHIPVVMATDNNYIPLVVSLTSMIENAGKNTFYDIYVLIDDSFIQESEFAVRECLSTYGTQCAMSFINVGCIFDNALISIPHITRPTYFRLAIPDLLNEDKCLYLDTDTIIMSDLQDLFSISLDNCYIAGVRHPGVEIFNWEDTIRKNAKIPSAAQYINAGVLVMNLKKMRLDGMVRRFLELICQNMPSQDQDIINRACYGKIALIPFKYNVITKLADASIEDYNGCYSEMELKEAWNNPCIIHYADRDKPWNSGVCVFIESWWRFCRKSPLFDCVVHEFFREFIADVIYHLPGDSMFTKKIPKLFDIAFERKYVIYGAGKRSRETIIFLKQWNIIPEYIIVSDAKENPSKIEDIEIKSIADVCHSLYDKSIVIAVRENLHREIIRNLQKYDYLELFPVSDDFPECIKGRNCLAGIKIEREYRLDEKCNVYL